MKQTSSFVGKLLILSENIFVLNIKTEKRICQVIVILVSNRSSNVDKNLEGERKAK